MSDFKQLQGFLKYEANENKTIIRNIQKKSIVGLEKGSIRLYNDAGERVTINKKDFDTKLLFVGEAAKAEPAVSEPATKKEPVKKKAAKKKEKAVKPAKVKKTPKLKKERNPRKRVPLKIGKTANEKIEAIINEHPKKAFINSIRKEVASEKITKNEGIRQLYEELSKDKDVKRIIMVVCEVQYGRIYNVTGLYTPKKK